MRILVVTAWLPTDAHPQTGLSFVRDIELLTRLHEVDVIHLAAAAPARRIAGVRRQRSITMRPSDPRTVWAAGKTLRRALADYDSVHTMAASALLPFATRPVPLPWIHTEHESSFKIASAEPLLARATLAIARRAMRRPDLVTVADNELDRVVRRHRSGPTVLIGPSVTEAAREAAYATAYERVIPGPAPGVDVVIAIHDARRDIVRAVSSVLTSRTVRRVIVICHNIDRGDIAAALQSIPVDPRVELHELRDGIPSPAGPFNAGLDLCTSAFVSIMGSDDELTPGAVDRWMAAASRHRADLVIPAVRYAGGARMATPPKRPWRKGALDAVRDRLAYRTAPLGLLRRSAVGTLRLTPRLVSGEDLAFSTQLWFSSACTVMSEAEYLVHDDAVRVTFTARPMPEGLAAVVDLLQTDDALTTRERHALAVKLWRITIFGAVHYRAGAWTSEERAFLAGLAAELRHYAPSALNVLSRADHDLVEVLLDPSTPHEAVDAASRKRRRFLSWNALMSHRWTCVLAREAPLRFAVATTLAGR